MFKCRLRKGETKDALVQTAAGLLMRQSFGAVSVEDICKATGVKKGTFYHYFASKHDLAMAAYEHMWGDLRTELDRCFSARLQPLERLQAYADGAYRCHVEMFEKEGKVYGCPLCGAGQEMAAQDEAMRLKLEQYTAEHCRYFESVLRDLEAFRSQTRDEIEKLAREMFFYGVGVLFQAKVANDPEVIRRDLLAGLVRLTGCEMAAENEPTIRSITGKSREAADEAGV
jgi:TetR/AcrR family transcriptional repressor of nem operon